MTITVTDEYLGIQPEGVHTGVPMYFVEVQQTTDGIAKHVSEKEIIDRAKSFNARWLAIKAGKEGEDPLNQDLDTLIALAFSNNLKTFVETSGRQAQYVYTDWICLRPVKDKLIEPIFKQIANEIICDINEGGDLEYYVRNFYNPNVPFNIMVPDKNLTETMEKISGQPNVRIFSK